MPLTGLLGMNELTRAPVSTSNVYRQQRGGKQSEEETAAGVGGVGGEAGGVPVERLAERRLR